MHLLGEFDAVMGINSSRAGYLGLGHLVQYCCSVLYLIVFRQHSSMTQENEIFEALDKNNS